MSVRFVFEPRKTVTPEQFSAFPPYSIAVDGYCSGKPFSTADGLRLNINHHEDCDRIATRSSCAQSLHLVKMGLYDTFSKNGKPHATIYCNACDQDVVWATYVLRYPEHADRPRLKLMVQLEDLLDMSAGLYPIKKRWTLLKKLLWVCEPYTTASLDGSICSMDGKTMGELVNDMHRRIWDTLRGKGKEIEPDTAFEIIAEFPNWSFIREIGAHARIGIAQKGIKAFVKLKSHVGGRYDYVIVRPSRFIRWFPLEDICARLNEADGIAPDGIDRWGGGDNVIGSPRARGSRLREDAVLSIVKEACDEVA